MREHVPPASEPTREQRERLRGILQPGDVSPMTLPTYLLDSSASAPWEEGVLEEMEKVCSETTTITVFCCVSFA